MEFSEAGRAGTPAPADAVPGILEGLVRGLGLAGEATFVPAAPDPGAPDRVPGAQMVGVHGLDGVVEGHLRCSAVSAGAAPCLQALADLAGAALGQARRVQELIRSGDAFRRVAEQLQDSLLPPLPEVAHTTIAVRYRAAAREARVGGDFYDVFPLPDGAVLVVVGDVVGKGIAAAVRTSRITQTLRAMALQGLALEQLLARVDEQVSFQDPEILATLWCGLYRPDSGQVTFASRGHPPALLLRAEGSTVRLESLGLPLGMSDLDDSAPDVRVRTLGTRDLLVIYTDGVIEASGDVIAGLQALHGACERRRDEALEYAIEGVLDELLADAGYTDDAVVLMLRRR